MSISHSLERSLNEMFSVSNSFYYPLVQEAPSEVNNKLFSRFLNIEIPTGGECFIPKLQYRELCNKLLDWLDSNPEAPLKVSYPLFVGGTEEKKTGDSVIQSINRCNKLMRLSHIVTTKERDYYGGNGLIFTDRWNPIFMIGFIINIDKENRKITFKHPICYVSPRVFIEKDILSKTMIKKIIPHISSRGALSPTWITGNYHYRISSEIIPFLGVPVVVKYLENYFQTPVQPSNPNTFNEDIWEFLKENEEQV